MLIGQVLGLIVVVAAVAVLGVGAMSFIDDDAGVGAASPSPSSLAASVAPAAPTTAPGTLPAQSAAPSPTIDPGQNLTPEPSLEPLPTAGATPFELQVQVGPGFITFGTERNRNLRITDARTQFPIDERMVWSAELIEPTDTWLLSSRIYKVDLENGTERLVDERGEKARVAAATLVSSSLVPARRLDGPGIYVMRYVQDGRALSTGYFEVTDE